MKNRFEIPPTAGLPPRWSDLFPGKRDFATGLEHHFSLVEPQIECSGTAAFIVALTALKQCSHRKEVIIPAYTCPLVAMAVNHCGLKLTLCDLADNHFDFDFDQLARLANDNTLAIVPTHLGGRIADIARAKQIADPCGATVIEDAAQALGAEVGDLGDITFFSMAVGKGLSIYEGGILTANDPAMREKLKKTAQKHIRPNRILEWRRCLELIGYTAFYRPRGLHYIYGKPRRNALKTGNLIEAVGDRFPSTIPLHPVSQWRKNVAAQALERLPTFLADTRRQALERCQRLQAIEGIQVFQDDSEKKGVWPFLMVLMPDAPSRNQVLARLWDSPLGVSRLFIHALPDYAYLAKTIPQTHVPKARDFADRLLTITNSLWLDEPRFEAIFQVIKSAVKPPASIR
ncbi:MAG: DegT/DnrJ/EryC1/StrS family aminotransferase [Betaproteobacteria bacterium]|nr:DegT/DnrJ/EryC1/StrS family aminotransferase [Betaproteobacteria bacterium]